MTSSDDTSYGYVLYIDEAGDDGLARVKPIDENGAGEGDGNRKQQASWL